MRTKDLENLGIYRSFARKCKDQHLISPEQVSSQWIVDTSKKPYKYTQEDVETIWNAYLYRKMGVSFEDIKRLHRGEPVPVRALLDKRIEDLKRQRDELDAVLQYTQLVKGFGFLIPFPEEVLGCKSFKEYVLSLGESKEIETLIKFFSILDQLTHLDSLDELEESTAKEFEQEMEKNSINLPSIKDEVVEQFFVLASSIMQLKELKPDSEAVQNEIRRFLTFVLNLFLTHETLSLRRLAYYIYFILTRESDFTVFLNKHIGRDKMQFFVQATHEFYISESKKAGD